VPTAYLIAPDGTVTWQGHPGDLSDEQIEEQLKEVAKEDRVTSWSFLLSRALPDAGSGWPSRASCWRR